MSAQRNAKRQSALTATDKQAIVAACAVGAHKGQLAEQFGIRRETVSRILKDVKMHQSPANPFTIQRDTVKHEAWTAVMGGLRCKRNPYEAGRLGVTVLQGVGELVTGTHQVGGQVELKITWGSEDTAIDITPEPTESST